MAILTTRYNSNCLGRYVSFTAIVPFEDFGADFLNPNSNPYVLQKPLKTLYLLHGATGDEKDWLYGTRIERYAIEHNIAIIMPAGNNSFYVNNSETEKWGDFIGKELVEVTRNLLPLSTKREDTYIGGLSMGGYGAIRNGLKFSETFSRIIALSSALIIYDVLKSTEDAEMPWQRKSHYEKLFGPVDQIMGSDIDPEALYLACKEPVKIFMAVGTQDFLIEHNRQYQRFLEAQGADLTYKEGPGAHEWDFWDQYILEGLEWICA